MYTLSKYADRHDTSTFDSSGVNTSQGCFQQPRACRDRRRIHTYPKATAVTGDGSLLCGDPVGFQSWKTLELKGRPLYQRPSFQSPARVFAKLKADAVRNAGGTPTHGEMYRRTLRDGGRSVFVTPRKGQENAREANWTTSESDTADNGAEAVTISPLRTPRHRLPHREPLLIAADTRHALVDRSVCSPMRAPGQRSSRAWKATPSKTSKGRVRTPSKVQPQQWSNSTFATKAVVSLERCPLTTAMVSSHIHSPPRKFTNQRLFDGMSDLGVEPLDSESQSVCSLTASEDRDPRDPELTDSNASVAMDDRLSAARYPPVIFQHPRLHELPKAVASMKQDPSSLRCLMSPAKLFSQMKERTSKQQQEACDVRNGFAGHIVAPRTRSTFTAFGQAETVYGTQMDTFSHLLKRGLVAKPFNAEAADGPLESSRKDEPFVVKSQPLLVEDPLVIHSPQLFLPKKHKAVFKQIPSALEKRPKSKQQESGYELTQWTLKFNREGLYLDGVRTSDNILWHSTVIAERISKLVLKTVSGSTYTLIGKMNFDADSKLPQWLLKKFAYGFPVHWKMYMEQFLSQPKTAAWSTSADNQTMCSPSTKPTTNSTKPKPEKMPQSTRCVPPVSLSMKTSRSGRMLKPPLDFWKGGRVFVDASMNVTIHEAYETTMNMAPSNTPDTILASPPPKQHDAVLRDCGEEPLLPLAPQRSESPSRPVADHQPSGPQRKVNATRRGHRAKEHKPANDPIHPPKKGQPRGRVSPEDQVVHATSKSQLQRQLSKAAPRTARAPHRQDPMKGGSTRSETTLPRKRNRPASKEPPVAHRSSSPSGEDIPVRRKTQRKGNVIEDSQSSDSSRCSLIKAGLRKAKGKRGGGSVPKTTKGQPKTQSKKVVGSANCASKTAFTRKLNPPVSKQLAVAHSSASSSDEDVPVRKKAQRKGTPRNVIPDSQSSQSPGSSKAGRARKGKVKGGSHPPKPAAASVAAQAGKRGGQSAASKKADSQEEEEENWTEAELMRLKVAVASLPKHMEGYWVNVALMVRTRSPEECRMQQMLQGSGGEVFSMADVAPKTKKKVVSTTGQEASQITAAVGTLRRKQQVREFMEAMPKDDHDDAFSSAAMQSRRFQVPSMSPGGVEQVFSLSNLEHLTPRRCGYPTAKTPTCRHMTPGMMGSVNRNNDDKYVYRLQKRMKRRQVNGCKVTPPMKTDPLAASVKPNTRKCGNMDDSSFVVREMFPINNGTYDESEEEDFYFSDSE